MTQTKTTILTARLTSGTRFSFHGEFATFVEWSGESVMICGMEYAEAHVVNGDQQMVTWSLPLGMCVPLLSSI